MLCTSIHPLLRRAGLPFVDDKKKRSGFIPSCEGQTRKSRNVIWTRADSSPTARGRLRLGASLSYTARFIPYCEGKTPAPGFTGLPRSIHPFLRRADGVQLPATTEQIDSSPLTKGRHEQASADEFRRRFIPSYEGQTHRSLPPRLQRPIHPFLRRADSVFMRLSAALNTSLCNLHKCRFRLVHIFNMPKNPPHFHFF